MAPDATQTAFPAVAAPARWSAPPTTRQAPVTSRRMTAKCRPSHDGGFDCALTTSFMVGRASRCRQGRTSCPRDRPGHLALGALARGGEDRANERQPKGRRPVPRSQEGPLIGDERPAPALMSSPEASCHRLQPRHRVSGRRCSTCHRVLVQELAAVEGLARVDVLCIDKTGTLTEPGLRLADIEVLSDVPRRDVEQVLAAAATADPAPNATIGALAPLGVGDATWRIRSQVPFSSSRQWSAVSFVDHGSWVLGASQVVLPEDESGTMARATEHERAARRVLILARAPEPVEAAPLPPTLEPVALVVLAEQLRTDAAATVRYLLEQGMTIKVLSGDAPETVARVADRLGIPSPGAAQDAGPLEDEPALRSALDATNLLGRIRPEQKLAVVNILQSQGHVVAMVGDGVNDVQALKQADLGIAMGSGSQSSRSVARVVLLDSAFSAVPRILAEGRKVIANIERVANLFVTKTVYAALLAAAIVVGAEPYPFFPRHLTIVDTLTIGVPGFFLAFESGAPRAVSGFTRRVLRFTVPAETVTAAATFASYLVARAWPDTTLAQARTAALLAVFAMAMWVLVLIARPFNPARLILVASMAAAFVVLFCVSLSRRVFALHLPPTAVIVVTGGIVVAAIGALTLWRRVAVDSRDRHRSILEADGKEGTDD